jgi:hypothetical protein
MDDKLICNNKSLIINLCKRFLNLEITDSNFKIGYYDNDDDLYLCYLCQDYLIRFDQVKEVYSLFHQNSRGGGKNKHAYHFEFSALSLITLISKVSTRHNPTDIQKKQSKIEELLFNKSNHTKSKPID